MDKLKRVRVKCIINLKSNFLSFILGAKEKRKCLSFIYIYRKNIANNTAVNAKY